MPVHAAPQALHLDAPVATNVRISLVSRWDSIWHNRWE